MMLATHNELARFCNGDLLGFYRKHGFGLIHVPIPHKPILDMPPNLAPFLQDGIKQAKELLADGTDLVIHCRNGLNRAPILAAHLLAELDALTLAVALERIKLRQPVVVAEQNS